MMQNNMTQAYEQGFMAKCAEYGVDPKALMKQAFTLADAARIGRGVWNGATAAGKGLARAGRAAGRLAGKIATKAVDKAKPIVSNGLRQAANGARTIGRSAQFAGRSLNRATEGLTTDLLGRGTPERVTSTVRDSISNLGRNLGPTAGRFFNATGDIAGRLAGGGVQALGVGSHALGRTARLAGDAVNYASRGLGTGLDSAARTIGRASTPTLTRAAAGAAGAAMGAGLSQATTGQPYGVLPYAVRQSFGRSPAPGDTSRQYYTPMMRYLSQYYNP